MGGAFRTGGGFQTDMFSLSKVILVKGDSTSLDFISHIPSALSS